MYKGGNDDSSQVRTMWVHSKSMTEFLQIHILPSYFSWCIFTCTGVQLEDLVMGACHELHQLLGWLMVILKFGFWEMYGLLRLETTWPKGARTYLRSVTMEQAWGAHVFINSYNCLCMFVCLFVFVMLQIPKKC
jgi:hypothetical protein